MEVLAEPVVSVVLESLSGWLKGEAKLAYQVRSQVEGLQRELEWMRCFLRDADVALEKEGERARNWALEVKDIAYDAEDAVETFVLTIESRRRRGGVNYVKRFACILKEYVDRRSVGLDIEDIKTRITLLRTNLQTYGIGSFKRGREGESSSSADRGRQLELRRSYSHVVEKDFVGLVDDVQILAEHLVNNEYHTVSICGMGGSGKTTLAQKVYSHPNVRRHFDGFAWVCVSQQLQKESVWKGILIKLMPEGKEDIVKMREEEAVKKLYQVLQEKKYLLVMDDIWYEKDWDGLRPGIPVGDMRTKILLTSRNKEVASYVDPHGFPHEPRLLTEDQGWELLQKKAFSKTGVNEPKQVERLEELGRKMVRQCGGLPLAVIVIGGVLATKKTRREWNNAYENIKSYIRKGQGMGQQHIGVSPALALSYYDLPSQLKQCFLYLGIFREDCKIETESSYRMWIAESMVSSKDGGENESLGEVAERYLGELAQRYMVQMHSDEVSGRVESCSLHDLMRDLCLLRAEEERFLLGPHGREKVADWGSNCKLRRFSRYVSKGGEGQRCLPEGVIAEALRSVLLYNEYVQSEKMRFHLKEFKAVRILHLEGFEFRSTKLKSIGQLIHLRYLSFKHSYIRKLPSSIGNLTCLQTLVLQDHWMTSCEIPNVLWKMRSLRHLYIGWRHRSNKKMKPRWDCLSELETLTMFYINMIDVKELCKLRKLRTMDVRLEVKTDKESKEIVNYLNNLANRLHHSSLRIICKLGGRDGSIFLGQMLESDHLNALCLEGDLGTIPELRHFSLSLAELSLSGSRLEEDPLATLERLPNLRSLELRDDAFVGVKMVCSNAGFPQLKFLHLFRLSSLEVWMVEEGAMPRLSTLEIRDCKQLRMIPDGLEFVTTLQELKIRAMPSTFERRLRVEDGEEGADLSKVQHVPSIDIRSFPFAILSPQPNCLY